MSTKAARYEKIIKEEQDMKNATKGTYYKSSNYGVTMVDHEEEAEVAVAALINKKPYVLKTGRIELSDLKTSSSKPTHVYTFDIAKVEAIFDQLMVDKMVKLHPSHKFPSTKQMKGREYYKYHNSWSHATNNCIVLRNDI